MTPILVEYHILVEFPILVIILNLSSAVGYWVEQQQQWPGYARQTPLEEPQVRTNPGKKVATLATTGCDGR